MDCQNVFKGIHSNNNGVQISLKGREIVREMRLRGYLTTRSLSVKDVEEIEAKGDGEAVLMIYNKTSIIENYDQPSPIHLNVQVLTQTESTIELEICQKWVCMVNTQAASRPTSVFVEIPSGFELDRTSRQILSSHGRRLFINENEIRLQIGIVSKNYCQFEFLLYY